LDEALERLLPELTDVIRRVLARHRKDDTAR
jgi:hypothetical protein